MRGNFDSMLAEYLIEHELISPGQLVECATEAGRGGRQLIEILISRGLVESAFIAELDQTLKMDLGETIALTSAFSSTPSGLQEELQSFEEGLRYNLLQPLGRGGMGQVHLVEDRLLRRDVAMKSLLPHLFEDTRAREQLVLEARLTGFLEHPSVIPVYDIGLGEDGVPYYSMRVAREKSLKDVLQSLSNGEEGPALSSLISTLRQVAMAVHYAHDQGVLHLDLKPGNILIGQYGEVFVIDWGIAKITNPRFQLAIPEENTPGSGPQMLVGSLLYMAPEQAMGEYDALDARTDVYALGAILYKILTLEAAHAGDSPWAILYKKTSEEPMAPSLRAPDRDIPIDLEEICLRALARDPAQRYPTAQAFARDLEAYLVGVKERQRRDQEADEAFALGVHARQSHGDALTQHGATLARLLQQRETVPGWAASSEKETLWQLEELLNHQHLSIEKEFGESVRHFMRALEHRPNFSQARQALCELYWGRFRQAEDARDRATAAYFENLVHQFNDGQYDELLAGGATLSLSASVPGAIARIFQYRHQRGRLVEAFVGAFDLPLHHHPVPHGSLLIEVLATNHAPLRLPVVAPRGGQLYLNPRLYETALVPPSFAVISEGAFIFGPQPRLGQAPTAIELPAFAICRYPVTCEEYLEFLNDLGPFKATPHAPRPHEGAESYFPVDKKGRFFLPESDQEGDRWHPKWPVCMINYDDAQAYARWLSDRDKRAYRVPTSDEWEKAARGVDGRLYPWGDFFDPSFCHMRESVADQSLPAPVGAYPIDCSPYGVYDMAGNIMNWTSTPAYIDGEHLMIRGGAFSSIPEMCRLDWGAKTPRSFRPANYGMRLALDLL